MIIVDWDVTSERTFRLFYVSPQFSYFINPLICWTLSSGFAAGKHESGHGHQEEEKSEVRMNQLQEVWLVQSHMSVYAEVWLVQSHMYAERC